MTPRDVDLVVTVTAPVTDDANYRALSGVSGRVRVFDDDIAGVVLEVTAGLTTYEAENGCASLDRRVSGWLGEWIGRVDRVVM